MISLDEVNVGDRFACQGRNGIVLVAVARVTKTMVTDTKGRRWLRRNGASVGGSEWDRQYLETWTEKHKQAVLDQRQDRAVATALRALGDLQRKPEGRARLRAALPHLQAAVAALGADESGVE